MKYRKEASRSYRDVIVKTVTETSSKESLKNKSKKISKEKSLWNKIKNLFT
jgi:hypothetical protein